MASTLVINPGSSSRKFALYVDGRSVVEMRFEASNSGFEVCSQTAGTQQICESISERDFSCAFKRVADEVNQYLQHQAGGANLDNIVVRIVAPGTYFQQHRVIDRVFIDKLKERESSAPLHIPIILREIDNVKHNFPATRIIAASDSAFHATMPSRAREYSLPKRVAEEYDIHRFGYHGLSVSSIVRRIHAVIGIDPERMIVCHIGNGTSVTAVKSGKSVETSMGFAPSTGVPMGSRGGDIDNAALLEIMKRKNLRPLEAELYINVSAGLQGLGEQSDIRMLLERRAHGDAQAVHTLDVFAYHLQKTIAAQTVALGGLDVLVFTATASVRSAELRSLISTGLEYLGVKIGQERNDLLVGKDGIISVRNSPVKVVVMRTDEMGEMACTVTKVEYDLESS